jgi:hypothetical protein
MPEIEAAWCRSNVRRSTALECWQDEQTKCSHGQPAIMAAATVGYIHRSAPAARRAFQMPTASFAALAANL